MARRLALLLALLLAAALVACATSQRVAAPAKAPTPRPASVVTVDPARRVIHAFGTVDYKRWDGVPTPPTVLHTVTRSEYWIDRQTGNVRVTFTEKEAGKTTFLADEVFAGRIRTAYTRYDSSGLGPRWEQTELPTGYSGRRGDAVSGLVVQRDFRRLVASGDASVVASGSSDGTATLVLHVTELGGHDTTAVVRASDYLPVRVENTEWSDGGKLRAATRTVYTISGIMYVPWSGSSQRFLMPPPADVPVRADRTLSRSQASEQASVTAYWVGASFEGRPLQEFRLKWDTGRSNLFAAPPRVADHEVFAEYYLKADRDEIMRQHGAFGGSWAQLIVVSAPHVPIEHWPEQKGAAWTTVGGRKALKWTQVYGPQGGPRKVLREWLIIDEPDATLVLDARLLPEGSTLRAANALRRLR